jgi:hypothetical protein
MYLPSAQFHIALLAENSQHSPQKKIYMSTYMYVYIYFGTFFIPAYTLDDNI